MTTAMGPCAVTKGSEPETQLAQAVPLQFSPLQGGDWDAHDLERGRGRRRLRWQIGSAAALALAVASFVIVIDSSVYEARSSVLIRPPDAKNGVPQAVDGALQSELEILQSFEVLRQTLESIGVDVLYPGLPGESIGAVRASAIARMREALAVRTMPGSDVIEVTFRHPDAQLAADVVNRLVERFRRSRGEMLAPAVSERLLQDRIEEQRAALAAAETSLAAFLAEHPTLAGKDPSRSLADRRLALEAELRTQRDAIDTVRSARSEDPSVVRARARVDELELELRKTLNTHVEGSRAVAQVRSEIGRARDYRAEQERAAKGEQGRRLEQLRSRQLELEAQLTELGQAERELPELERQGRELARERDLAARRLDAYQRELESQTLLADVDGRNVAGAMRVLESAHAPTTPMIPEERAQYAWALLGVALLVLIGAFLLDVLEQRRPDPPPMVWTANVGAGGAGGSLALLMPTARGGPAGGPFVLLVPGAGAGDTARAVGGGPDSRD